jgi:dTMP kinase
MFICFEGIAGAGKTTQVKILEKYLESKEIKIFSSAIYENRRRKLISNFINEIGIKHNKEAVMFLFQALHAAQYEEVLVALKEKKIVIADRWRYSFWTYHLYQQTY